MVVEMISAIIRIEAIFFASFDDDLVFLNLSFVNNPAMKIVEKII